MHLNSNQAYQQERQCQPLAVVWLFAATPHFSFCRALGNQPYILEQSFLH
jgi:hypothetical protein